MELKIKVKNCEYLLMSLSLVAGENLFYHPNGKYNCTDSA
jgi:hypothetical protein